MDREHRTRQQDDQPAVEAAAPTPAARDEGVDGHGILAMLLVAHGGDVRGLGAAVKKLEGHEREAVIAAMHAELGNAFTAEVLASAAGGAAVEQAREVAANMQRQNEHGGRFSDEKGASGWDLVKGLGHEAADLLPQQTPPPAGSPWYAMNGGMTEGKLVGGMHHKVDQMSDRSQMLWNEGLDETPFGVVLAPLAGVGLTLFDDVKGGVATGIDSAKKIPQSESLVEGALHTMEMLGGFAGAAGTLGAVAMPFTGTAGAVTEGAGAAGGELAIGSATGGAAVASGVAGEAASASATAAKAASAAMAVIGSSAVKPLQGIDLVNGKLPRNAGYAGERYYFDPEKYPKLAAEFPEGIEFTPDGYPDFRDIVYEDPVAGEAVIKSDKLTGGDSDFTIANREMASENPAWRQPKGYTWHHHQDGQTMLLVRSDVHKAVPHTGGAASLGGRVR